MIEARSGIELDGSMIGKVFCGGERGVYDWLMGEEREGKIGGR